MRLLVLGAGGIGGYFGGRLAAAGVDVTFLVRLGRAAALARDGLVVLSPLGDMRLPVRFVTEVDRAFDAVLLACKAYDLPDAMASVAPAVGPGTIVLPLLNGLRHLDVLDARYGRDRVLGGLCHIGVTLTGAGEVQHLNRLQRFALGPRAPGQKAPCAALHATLTAGGFGPVLSPAVMQDMWEKFVLLAAYAGITCLMRAPIGAIAATEDGAALASELLDECAAVATAAGHPPRTGFLDETRAMLTQAGSTGAASMLRDIGRVSRTEGEHVLGDMLARSRGAGLRATLLRVARAHVQAYEAGL